MKTKNLFSLALIATFGMSFVSSRSFAANDKEGAHTGGGGDATTEMRVDEIRSDILKWINDGGPQGLDFSAARLTPQFYTSAMSEQLQSHAVIIGSVTSAEENATYDPELKVNVDGQPKTCRGFISKNDGRAHILCNVERFANTPESKQYALIHHEYAGLARVEKNQGASSDYPLSSQITDFLVPQTVLKLAVKKPVLPEEPVPQVAQIARDVWQAIKENKILIPKEMEAGITARSEFGLIEVKVQTQLVEFSNLYGESKDYHIQLFPLWMSVAFDPAHPGSLAYARLRGALFGVSDAWNGGGANARVLDATAIIGIDGSTRSRLTGATFAGGEVHQYLDITSNGNVQLYLRGGANLSMSADSLRTMDFSDDKAATLLGEGGIRLMKQVLIRGRAQLNYFQPFDKNEEDKALQGLAPAFGGGVEWQLKRNVNIHGDFLRVNTSNLENNGGAQSVTGAMFGVLVNFW
jgi:hypothetical protein